jgi:hypothetical protein
MTVLRIDETVRIRQASGSRHDIILIDSDSEAQAAMQIDDIAPRDDPYCPWSKARVSSEDAGSGGGNTSLDRDHLGWLNYPGILSEILNASS